MAQIQGLINIYNNTKGTSYSIDANFDNIKTVYNAHDVATDGVHQIPIGEVIADNTSLQALIDKLCPVGEILDIWRPSDIVGFTEIDGDVLKLVDGQIIDDEDSLFDEVTLPDLSGRYLIGAGTLDAGDIGSTSVNATPVGAVNHVMDLSHKHLIENHTHSSHQHITSGVQPHNHSGYFSSDKTLGYHLIAHPYNPGQQWPQYLRLTVTPGLWSIQFPTPETWNSNVRYSTDTAFPGQIIEEYISTPTSFYDIYHETTSINNTYNDTLSGTTNPIDIYYTAINTDLTDANIQPKSLPVKRYIRYK